MRHFARLSVLCLFGAAIVLGSDLAMFINLPSLLIVLGGGLFVPLSFHSPRAIKSALSAGLSETASSPEEIKTHVGVLATIRTSVVGSGVLGTLIGLVQMLAHFDDPTQIGPAMAVALLTLVYSVFLSELYVAPMINGLLVQDSSHGKDEGQSPTAPSGILNVTAIFSALASFGILLQAF